MSEPKTDDKNHSPNSQDTASVLIIDDDPQLIRFMLEILAKKGIHANLANNREAAADFLDKATYDMVFLSQHIRRRSDAPSQPNSGFELLKTIRTNSPEIPAIMIAEEPEIKNEQLSNKIDRQCHLLHWAAQEAIKAIRAGCNDFLIKPLNRQKVEILLDTYLPNHSVSMIASAQDATRHLYQIVGRSPKLLQTIELAQKVAPTSAPVLITGDSGTGKELISILLHHKSRRAQGPYIRVNCAALSDTLLESELFGHEKGAFTGAYCRRKGRFEMAHGGTLLLDEITETPIKFQSKLLRILEQQDFERVGGNENVRVNVRIISTTNKDLLQQVQQNRFRRDLYYRLSSVRLVVASLRERREDLQDLVWHFVNLYAREAQRRITKLDPSMMEIFAKYHWPGNVRQLRNVVRTSLILGTGETLSLADVSWLFDELQPLPQERESDFAQRPQNCEWSCQTQGTESAAPHNRRRSIGLGGIPLARIEQQAILDTLRQTAGNRTKAAKVLGISDRTLRDKIRRYREQQCLQTT